MKKHGTILIVDDSKALLSLISEMLEQENYTTQSVETGEEALIFLENNHPDLILLDRTMSGMGGFEVCKRIKSIKKIAKIPIIFLTATADVKDKVEGFRIGAVDYITKPFQKEELLARVNSHVDLYKMSLQLKEQADELRKSEVQLKELNATKDKFFSIIAHDLKGPFSNILGLSRLLMDNCEGNDKEIAKDLVHHLNSTVENTHDLLVTLLDWASIQRGKMPFDLIEINLNEIVRGSLVQFGTSAKAKDIILNSNVSKDALVFADLNMLSTILRNLISNAIKFTPNGGSINVSGKRTGDKVEVCVADTGVGMDSSVVKKMFKINEVQSTLGTNGEQGTGLGLLLCKEFVEKNGGEISIFSEKGKGSEFRFTLPTP